MTSDAVQSNGASSPADSPKPPTDDSLAEAVVNNVATVLEERVGDHEALSREAVEAVVAVLSEEAVELVPEQVVLADELSDLHSSRDFIQLLRSKRVGATKIRRALDYERDLEALQVELVKFQRWVQQEGRRVAILFEGRDAAGKGGTIRRFIEHMNPRAMRVVALPKPTEDESGQWYFQRYMRQLPNRGEIVFFDRSWYNRAVVEPVNGFCTAEEYERFMRQVPEFEHMLVEDGVDLVKFWFSISRDVQAARFDSRRQNPLKQWKLSPLDERAQELWSEYTRYKESMFSRTHTTFSPWIIVQANVKRVARLESMRWLLSMFDYDGKSDAGTILVPDPNVVGRFHRAALRID